MLRTSLFSVLILSCATLLASGRIYGPNQLVSGWGLPAIGVPGRGGTLGGREVISWGIPIVLKGPSNPPAPVGQPAPVPQPPAPIACPASCKTTTTAWSTSTSTSTTTTTTTSTTTSISISVSTTTSTSTLTTPGIMPSDIADGSAACMAMDPAAPTPMFNEYAGFQCCIPIQTRDASGAMVDLC